MLTSVAGDTADVTVMGSMFRELPTAFNAGYQRLEHRIGNGTSQHVPR